MPETVEMDSNELDEVAVLPAKKHHWLDRISCVENLAAEMADNGGKYEQALRGVRIADYCLNVKRLTGKAKADLRRDAKRRAREILAEREAATVGDIVRVPKLVRGPLGYEREGRRLVEAEIVSSYTMSGSVRYRVRRLEDDGQQEGNGHMIKGIVKQTEQTEAMAANDG